LEIYKHIAKKKQASLVLIFNKDSFLSPNEKTTSDIIKTALFGRLGRVPLTWVSIMLPFADISPLSNQKSSGTALGHEASKTEQICLLVLILV
jgi:hypothetical protein